MKASHGWGSFPFHTLIVRLQGVLHRCIGLIAIAAACTSPARADTPTGLTSFAMANVTARVNGSVIPLQPKVLYDIPGYSAISFPGVADATLVRQTTGQHISETFDLEFDMKLHEGYVPTVRLGFWDQPTGSRSGTDATNSIRITLDGSPAYSDQSHYVETYFDILAGDSLPFATYIVFNIDADQTSHVHLNAVLYTDYDAPGSSASIGLGDPQFTFQLEPIPVPEIPMMAMLLAGLPIVLARRRHAT